MGEWSGESGVVGRSGWESVVGGNGVVGDVWILLFSWTHSKGGLYLTSKSMN